MTYANIANIANIGVTSAITTRARPFTEWTAVLVSQWVSRPKEFHLEPLAEPYVTLSRHTAPVIQPDTLQNANG